MWFWTKIFIEIIVYFVLFSIAIVYFCNEARAEDFSQFDDQEEAFDAELYGEPLPENQEKPIKELEQGFDYERDCFTAFDSETNETIVDCCIKDGVKC